MTQTISGDLEALRAAMGGPVFGPGDDGYDDARTVWNGDIDRRPAVIARCTSTADVAAAIGFARSAGWRSPSAAAATTPPALAVCDGGLMIDLSPLNEVTVDPEAAAGAGRRWGAAGATSTPRPRPTAWPPFGLVSHTGVGGLTLGGGIGLADPQGRADASTTWWPPRS